MTYRARERIEREVVCLLAGFAAERKFTGRRNHVAANADTRAATDLAAYACGTVDEVSAFLAWLSIRTRDLVEVHWLAVVAVAEALIERCDSPATRSGD
jgi:hypothetical protein